jgi:small subunit ribosomal protein S16
MVKIRLRRTGAKKQPSYRVVVADARSPRDGRFIEIIGHYNPRTEPATVDIQEERALYWLSVGAQPTETVQYLLKNLGTLERFASLKQGGELEKPAAEAKASRERRGEPVASRSEAESTPVETTSPETTEDEASVE